MTESKTINLTITGDSDEYDFITQGVELSAQVEGVCIEIGLRMGMGTKTIIDAVRQYCPQKQIVSVDPYGHIEYVNKEGSIVRLDYTNQMHDECLAAMHLYVLNNPVAWQFFKWTDTMYFKMMWAGVPCYDMEEVIEMWYSFVALDGPHDVASIKKELDFFIPRMKSGACIVFDDISPEWYPHQDIRDYAAEGFNIIRTGGKKELWQKK